MKAVYVDDRTGKQTPCDITRWNPHGLGEVIVYFEDGSADSVFFKDVEPVAPETRDSMREYLNAREP